nr:hypothetical protein [Tanacetum cinerariifolium]
MINHVNNWEKANKEHNKESIIAELERYKERVKTFEQRLNIDLSCREKRIDSQMDDMIKEKHALKEKKAQWIKPTLYDGIFIFEKHVTMIVIDDEETLILEEESRSKMSEKAKDLEVIAKKISHKPIDYEKLNRLTDDFGKHFTPQQELSAEQAFWLHISNPTIESSLPPIRLEVPSELPKGIQRSESCAKCLNLDAEFSKSKQAYNDLLKKYSQLEKHCISLEVSMQLKQEVFQNDESCVYQNAPEIPEYFKKNDLKAQLKDKDTTICKSKDTIKSLRNNNKEKIVDHDRCDLATFNKELENSVAKLVFENERLCKEINHVKQVFKDQFDSIKQTRVLQKEHNDSLINKLNLKYAEHKDLKAQIQDKVFVITSLKNDLRKLKRKATVHNVAQIPSATIVAPGMFKLDLEPLAPKLVHNMESHSNIKNNRISQPSGSNKINKVEDQPRSVKTRKNKKNPIKKVKCDDHVMQSMSNANFVSVSINNVPVKNYVNDVQSGCLCAICGKCMIAKTHHVCVHFVVTKTNESQKSKSTKKHKKPNVWKPMGHVFTEVGLKWKPTGKTFTIVGNSCPLTRFTQTNVVLPKTPTSHSDEIQKPKIKVYCRKPKNAKNIGSRKLAKLVESKNANHSERNHAWGSIANNIPSSYSLVMIGTVRFENDQIARIMGYGDYQLGNVIISRRQRLRAGYAIDNYLISTSVL